MKGINQFETNVDPSTLERLGVSALLIENEEPLGIYWNKAPNNFCVITTHALILPKQSLPIRFRYDEMESSLINVDEKTDANEVEIKLKNGEVVKVTIDGGAGKFRDVFAFGRFIDRVINDHKQ